MEGLEISRVVAPDNGDRVTFDIFVDVSANNASDLMRESGNKRCSQFNLVSPCHRRVVPPSWRLWFHFHRFIGPDD